MDFHQLNGSQRVVLDGVLTESECKDILRLAEVRLNANTITSSGKRTLTLEREEPAESLTPSSLFQAAGGTGDGYRGRRSPHTPHERFEGLTVLKALQVSVLATSQCVSA